MSLQRSVTTALAASAQKKTILVTGANSGIGLALCKQLIQDHDCRVVLGARNAQRGEAAVQAVKDYAANADASVELLLLDVSDQKSVRQAAQTLQDQKVTLSAIVNNAGRGFAHNASPEEVLDVNLFGTKRVVDAFLPLLDEKEGRIVSLGSGGGAAYVSEQSVERQKLLCSEDITWDQIEELARTGLAGCVRGGYGLSKALVASYNMVLAREHPNLMVFCLSPGYIKTAMTAGGGATLEPEEGTKSLKHCLFTATKEQSGWFFGSDCNRSPLHFMRNPGMPVFDGVYPWQKQS